MKNDTTVSLPLVFEMKLISPIGFGFTLGNLLTISMNKNYQDSSHMFFGLCYTYPIKKWDIEASLIVFPVYIPDDELIAGKIDVSYWFIKYLGITMTTIFGGTTTWADNHVLLFSASMGLSVKI